MQVAASRDIGEQNVSENNLLVIVKRKHHSPFQKKFEASINMNVEVAIVSTKGFDISYQIVKIVKTHHFPRRCDHKGRLCGDEDVFHTRRHRRHCDEQRRGGINHGLNDSQCHAQQTLNFSGCYIFERWFLLWRDLPAHERAPRCECARRDVLQRLLPACRPLQRHLRELSVHEAHHGEHRC